MGVLTAFQHPHAPFSVETQLPIDTVRPRRDVASRTVCIANVRDYGQVRRALATGVGDHLRAAGGAGQAQTTSLVRHLLHTENGKLKLTPKQGDFTLDLLTSKMKHWPLVKMQRSGKS